MSNFDDDVERTIAALRAIQLVRDCYASGSEGAKRTKDILEMLAMGGTENSLRKHMAVAISNGLSHRPVPS